MAPVQTQTIRRHQFSNSTRNKDTNNTSMPILSGRISKPPARSTRTSKPLLSYSPQIPVAHPSIDLTLLRNKLLLTCRAYIPSTLLHAALADGIYSRAQRWITPSSLSASRHGKSKRYFILDSTTFELKQVSSAWEARICSSSQPIDAGNGVVLFVKERREWEAFMRGYKRQGKRVGVLLRGRERDVEREWREGWKRRCGFEDGSVTGKKEVNAGPMWVLVKSAVARIIRGEA